VDENAAAVKIMENRLKPYSPTREDHPLPRYVET
jgi:hypothetical protein